MKRVLFLSPLSPPHYGAVISSEMCLDILKDARDFDIENIKLNYSEKMSDIGRINLKKLKGVFRVKKEIREKIEKMNPDIIYFVPATSGLGLIRDFLFVREIKKYWGGQIVFHIRSRITNDDWRNPLYRKLYTEIFREGKAIVLDENLKKDLHGLIGDKNIFVLPNAIENKVSGKKFDKIIRRRRLKSEFNILFLSNMDESKGWLKLLYACKILNEKNIKFNCNFVGDWTRDKERKKFYSYIKKNNLEKMIKYLGKRVGKEKNTVLEKSDILVFPTYFKLETFGRVIIEAMMFGLPVIANGIAAIPTTIQDGKTGFILKDNSPEEIANYIERLLNRKLREKMGKAGRERFLKKYEIGIYGMEFLDVFLRYK